MLRLFGMCFACVFALAMERAKSAVPGMASALYGDIAGHSDFELNLRPPEDSVEQIRESLDALMKSEDNKRKAAQADFISDKERMLQSERIAIQQIVSAAFQPLLASLKNQ